MYFCPLLMDDALFLPRFDDIRYLFLTPLMEMFSRE